MAEHLPRLIEEFTPVAEIYSSVDVLSLRVGYGVWLHIQYHRKICTMIIDDRQTVAPLCDYKELLEMIKGTVLARRLLNNQDD